MKCGTNFSGDFARLRSGADSSPILTLKSLSIFFSGPHRNLRQAISQVSLLHLQLRISKPLCFFALFPSYTLKMAAPLMFFLQAIPRDVSLKEALSGIFGSISLATWIFLLVSFCLQGFVREVKFFVLVLIFGMDRCHSYG